MSRFRRVIHGVASSYVLLAATAFYSLASVPVALHYLDIKRFGLWIVHGQGTERECAPGAVFSGFPNVVTIHGNMAELARLFGARLGGIADIAGGAAGAELLGADDWDGLTEAVGRWVKNGNPPAPAAAGQMRAKYHPLVVARRHLEIYREVLAANNKS